MSEHFKVDLGNVMILLLSENNCIF